LVELISIINQIIKYMAQNAFRKHKGHWVCKEHTVKASAGAIEAGDLIMITSGGITVELGTNAATAIVGISAEDLASSTATQTIRVWEPAEPTCEMIGRVTDGAIAAGDTDSNRGCDLEDHEGADTDTDTHHHLVIVKGTVATTDGATTEGEAIFRIAQTVDKISAF
jgi:hypothetical protein